MSSCNICSAVTDRFIMVCRCLPVFLAILKEKISTSRLLQQNQKLAICLPNYPAPKEPIWKRRGALPIPPLKLEMEIRSDMSLEEKYPECHEPLLVVLDSEWVQRQNWYEVHSTDEIAEGVVINPPCYPRDYVKATCGKVVPAQLPYVVDYLIGKALSCNYQMNKLVERMGRSVAEYCATCLSLKDRKKINVLILAGEHWQGASAIYGGSYLRRLGVSVSLYVDGSAAETREEAQFRGLGGNVHHSLNDLKGQTFKVILVALDNSYSQASTLHHYGEWLKTGTAVFVDPPVLKCSYTTALQIATAGSYNICQRTAIFTPSLPKPYIIDKFMEMFVVNTGIPEEIHNLMGIEYFNFPLDSTRKYRLGVEQVFFQNFVVKGSKIYFYENRQLLSN